MSEWYDWCKANHVCYRCGKVRADEGYTTCLACRMALRERKKELRSDHINPSEIRNHQRQREQEQNNRAIGLCRCGNPVTAGYKTCVSCRTKASLAAARRRRRKGVESRQMWIEEGRCWLCGQPAKDGYKLCEKHYAQIVINGHRGRGEVFDKENQIHFARSNYEKKNMRRCCVECTKT